MSRTTRSPVICKHTLATERGERIAIYSSPRSPFIREIFKYHKITSHVTGVIISDGYFVEAGRASVHILRFIPQNTKIRRANNFVIKYSSICAPGSGLYSINVRRKYS